MNTPICDFVKKYNAMHPLRLHMPGHKGLSLIGPEAFDITEIDGADVLYAAKSIIKESEKNASAIFGTANTIYSAEGSSLAIRAMLHLASMYAKKEGKKPLIAATRNSHKVFLTAAALLDIEISWIIPQNPENLLSCQISPAELEQIIIEKNPSAVYITSPDYLGNMADIEGLSKICKKYDTLLLVDNAHGSYLRFLHSSLHPMDLGADICCDSAHKTLPVLTGGAYLHISQNAPKFIAEQAEDAMALFASTSPSYLILQSLDAANPLLINEYPQKLQFLAEKLEESKITLKESGYEIIGNEPMKLTIAPKSKGYTGYELANILQKNNIICEFADPDFTVMMFSPYIELSELEYLNKILLFLPNQKPIKTKAPIPSSQRQKLSPQEAIFAPKEEIAVENAIGRILASANISCPPAIPIAICGEMLDEHAIECLLYYGIKHCMVIAK